MFLVGGAEEESIYLGVEGTELILTKNRVCAGGYLHDIRFSPEPSSSWSVWSSVSSLSLLVLFITLVAGAYPRLAAATCLLLPLLLLYRLLDQVVHEQLLTLPNVGIQYTSFYKFRRKTTFLDWNDIEDVIINEVIHSQKIIFVLTILIRTKDNNCKLMPLFMNLKPRLQCLESIYRDIQMLLGQQKS